MTDDRIVNDSPENQCFGCSPHNPQGLQLTFVKRGPGEVECRFTAAAHLCGAPGVVHGGIQAALLDEVMGVAVHAAFGDPDLWIVTADFKLRYRRPLPIGEPVLVRGRLLRSDGPDFYAAGEILGSGGEPATVAEARWRAIPRGGPSGLNPTTRR